jgi:hypothetical protein
MVKNHLMLLSLSIVFYDTFGPLIDSDKKLHLFGGYKRNSYYKSPNDSIRIRKQWKEVKRGERTGDDWSKDETSETTLPGHSVTSTMPSMGKVLKMSTGCDGMTQYQQTDRQTDRQRDRKTDRQTDRHMDRPAGIQTNRRQTGRQTHTDTQTDR